MIVVSPAEDTNITKVTYLPPPPPPPDNMSPSKHPINGKKTKEFSNNFFYADLTRFSKKTHFDGLKLFEIGR